MTKHNVLLVSILTAVSTNISLGMIVNSNEFETAQCPTQWKSAVDQIESIANGYDSNKSPVIMFVGEDGELFNCLHESIDEAKMDKMKEFIRSFSLIVLKLGKDDELPYNFCNIVSIDDKRFSVDFLVYLPYLQGEIDSVLCKKVLKQSLVRIKN